MKGINVSQLPIRNFNDVTGKHEYTQCFLFLRGSQAHFCKKQALLPVIH